MSNGKQRILVLVEGAKTDIRLMQYLLITYQIDIQYEIVPYCTNIYTLYHEMFEVNDPEDMDLLQLLKSREPDLKRKLIFNYPYSDVLLIFDLDPQDPGFSPEKIRRMAEYFVESSDVGKLYLNYPMVEAFYHMACIPDPNFDSYYASMDELLAHKYKSRVCQESRNHDYRKFATSREECNIVIRQNMSKAWRVSGGEAKLEDQPPAQIKVLNAQLEYIESDRRVAILSTCAFFIPEYNPKLIQ